MSESERGFTLKTRNDTGGTPKLNYWGAELLGRWIIGVLNYWGVKRLPSAELILYELTVP